MALPLFAAFFAAVGLAQEDPPYRVARLNHIEGEVSMEPAGIDQWAPAVVNRPFTTGDYLYTDDNSRAELHIDIGAIRMGPKTSFGFLNLNDQTVQIKLTEGDMYFRVHNFETDQTFEVDTPNAAVTLLRDGTYRFRVDPNGDFTFLVVRGGEAEVTGNGQAFTLGPGDSANITGQQQMSYDVEVAPAPDDFDEWCQQRDAREAQLASARYLPPTVIGYEDLDDYGGWQQDSDYGPVWYPRAIAADWAPYHYGHWAWIDPWGWTWVDDMPWGFAPFHYGRWAYIRGRWGWCPGPIAVVGYRAPVVRPMYAPALVAWFGGRNWGVSIGIGGPSLAWVPLGFGEVYTPGYVCSRRYFNNVNVNNTRIVNNVNITNVYNTVYVNKTVYNQTFVNERAPNAVVAMPQNAFASGTSVRSVARVVPAAQVAQIRQAVMVTPQVAPTQRAALPTLGRPAPHPVAQVIQQPVVARTTPPPARAPFAQQSAYIAQHLGQPHNFAAMHQQLAPHAQPVAPVRTVTPVANAVAARPGQRVGNPQPAAQVQRAPGQPQVVPSAVSPRERVANPPPANQPATQYERRSAPETAPAPAQHGVPPNQLPRENQTRQNQPEMNRERTNQPPAARPAEPTPPANQNRLEERREQPAPPSAARPVEPAPPANQNRLEERREPAAFAPAARPVEPAPPANQNRLEERREPPQPPARPAEPAPRPEVRREEAAPAARPEERPHTYPQRSEPRTEAPKPAEHQESKPAPKEKPKDDHSHR